MLFIQTWFKYSLYAVLVGLLMFTGCDIESKKYLKTFKEKISQDKKDFKLLFKESIQSPKDQTKK